MTDGVLLKEVQQVSLRALSQRDDPFQPLMIDGIFKHFDTFSLEGRIFQLSLCLPVSYADNLCKQSGPRSGPTKHRA